MPRPADLPRFTQIGPRVRWWRIYRGITQGQLAKKVGITVSTLSDFERGRQEPTKQLHLIAAELKLNAHYLESDKGEPELGFSQDPPQPDATWPFRTIPLSRLDKLNGIERKYFEIQAGQILNEIEAERRKDRQG